MGVAVIGGLTFSTLLTAAGADVGGVRNVRGS